MTRTQKAKQKWENKEFSNNNGELMIVKNYTNATCVQVFFPTTQTMVTTQMSNIIRGNVTNPIHGNERPSRVVDRIGEKCSNARGFEFVIIKQKAGKSLVKFLKTGTTKWVDNRNLNDGKVRDEYRKVVLDVGYQGNPDRKNEIYSRAIQLWSNMIKRCYSEAETERNMSYIQTKVCVRWHSFELFMKDIQELDNFNEWKERKQYDLDKDLLGDGTIYSPLTCIFLKSEENKVIQK